MGHACNPSILEVETGEVQSHPLQQQDRGQSGLHKTLYLKINKYIIRLPYMANLYGKMKELTPPKIVEDFWGCFDVGD